MSVVHDACVCGQPQQLVDLLAGLAQFNDGRRMELDVVDDQHGVVGGNRLGRLEVVGGVFEVAQRLVREPAPEIGVGALRVDLEDARKVGDGLVLPPNHLVRLGALVHVRRHVWLPLYRLYV